MNKALGIILAVLMAQTLPIAVVPAQESIALRDDFNNLDNWKPLTFPKIERHSEYVITLETEGNRILTARSKASASGIVFKGSFNPYRHPVLRWRWKVDNVYSKADPRTKEGDDYPLRVYVIFKYDPAKAGLGQRIAYGLAKKIYGEYPPLASLSYVWASRDMEASFFDNPFTDRAKMIPLRSGTEHLGKWVEEEVNILVDYRRIFGEDPPESASLAIMNDSDNTGEAAVSHLDFIEVRSSALKETSTRNP
ncbi:MAG: DUF3047 domain-containing protein [Desulfatirhabdiaceae bacterium]|nr:DUF3047 domain-containing protein [Desulfatirhabdiaceae bacterium]